MFTERSIWLFAILRKVVFMLYIRCNRFCFDMDRIDKILASQNYGSRKQVSQIIKSGVVEVNGEVCKSISQKVNPDTDVITVDGRKIEYRQHLYIMMNKPSGVVSASSDKRDKTVIDLLPENLRRKGLFPAGRLDKDTEGLLIITDDGEFAHQMLSPAKKVYKKYFARLDKPVTEEMKEKFEKGIVFSDGTRCKTAFFEETDDSMCAFVSICEGKFHQVKKMFLVCGANVVYLKRIAIGKLQLDQNLAPGEARELENCEKHLILFV